jgi:hypothetical protein
MSDTPDCHQWPGVPRELTVPPLWAKTVVQDRKAILFAADWR